MELWVDASVSIVEYEQISLFMCLYVFVIGIHDILLAI